ncbi:hypothetical protein [Longimicrobium terrae]|uniref:Uncharacterized protein n=1 Tax=Longimicrobium terrae TaxID=1639882 RepID=A0A841GZX8_9BACT|nr:hypothetical protein [Longimicrobium terrae]MBB4637027.1 hypothetical protein [Longimicrobium terrae]MBB6071365.1 hypothetical protein [Longimicrobium terrae]NNC31416.1 hypothetical protein [Longimicrobium terrae]
MKMRILLSLAAASILSACTSTNAVLLGGTGTYPELSPGEVRVFLHEENVPGDFERIALVTAESNASWTDETDLIRAMRRRAAKMGADAIIIGDLHDPTTLERVAEVLTDYQPQRRGRALAIRLVAGDAPEIAAR